MMSILINQNALSLHNKLFKERGQEKIIIPRNEFFLFFFLSLILVKNCSKFTNYMKGKTGTSLFFFTFILH